MDPYAKKQNYGALFSAGNDDYGNLARYMNDVDAKAERQRKIDYIMNESWPAKAAKSAWGAFTLPMEVYQGKVDPLSDEGIQRTADLAGMVTLGAGAVPAQANSLRMGIKAYHGSPHDFDKFRMDKIGTGEGAQAYGHGLYFADSEDVARSYRDALTSGSVRGYSYKGKPIEPNTPEFDLAYSAFQSSDGIGSQFGNGFNNALSSVYNKYRRAIQSGLADRIGKRKEIEDFLTRIDTGEVKESDFSLNNHGHLYEVNINANPDDFLDWDKSLGEQTEKVKAALGSRPWLEQPRSDDKAKMIYLAMGKTPEESSQIAKDAGILGIKYLDQGSRGAGEGSRNYVVFDENLINIVRKYGIVGALSSGLITAQQAKQFMQQEQSQQEFENAYAKGNAT